MKHTKEQVGLFKLVFTHNWEDPASDHAALTIRPKDSILAITSGGCNILGFLLFDPGMIYSIDINPAQSYLMQLKIAAMKALTFQEFSRFSGLSEDRSRAQLYEKVQPLLSDEARQFWNGQRRIIAQGFLMNGKYERFIRHAGKFIGLLQGRKRVLGLFSQESKEQQAEYFDKVWNTRRFRYIFKILFNKTMLAKRGLDSDYFHFDDGSNSFADSFYNRARKAFREIPIKGNYFLSLYLLGKYRSANESPAYLQEQNYAVIKSRLDRIKIITGDAQSWIDSMPSASIDCFALSNICELMSESETQKLFAAVSRTGRPGGRVIFRNLMIDREVPPELRSSIVKDEGLSRNLYEQDRSFVYGKVAAYNIIKRDHP
jgi:S-adenosylmethionine-diacylglycerol 3-amino-3-carboxypropyl transferase